MSAPPSLFQRLILPGLAFKAVVIGGGYATGRELVEYFMPSGPVGGLLGLVLVTALWSGICALTFVFAYATRSANYLAFFKALLGPFWPLFEIAYLLFLFLILAVFGAAAGEIGAALFDLPNLVGSAALALSILIFAALGQESVERLFKYASLFLYLVYLVFVVMCFTQFGGDILAGLDAGIPATGWVSGGITYAGYNVIGAVVILPMLRHLTSRKDAIIAGALAGPLAALPALLFFACMIAFYPEISGAALPSNYILERLGSPAFQMAFQFMVFVALVETSVSAVHAVNERISAVRPRAIGIRTRLAVTSVILLAAMVVADRFGLIALIANGYRMLAFAIIAVFVLPLLTLGVWKLMRMRKEAGA
ncbi:YkvI family membrane protein [Glycocaulis sp.]|uniref:YkvI family membrane protein n=1 Tax=Glycocaulis sp. TaxID=1969725 RepID=UPI003D1DEA34